MEQCSNGIDDDGDGVIDESSCLFSTSGAPASDSGVVPEQWQSNPDCEDLGYELGFKIDGTPVVGTYTLTSTDGTLTGGAPEDPSNTIEVTSVNGPGTEFAFESSLPFDAVFVKGGPLGGNAYNYDPATTGDGGLAVPGANNQISHVEFCYGYRLGASKDAFGTYTREITWDIDKSVDQPSHSGNLGDAGMTSEYTVTVTPTVTEHSYGAEGTITVDNATPFDADFEVTDLIDDGNGTSVDAIVTCPDGGAAGTVLAGGSVDCTYTASLPHSGPWYNTATIASTSPDVDGAEALADVIFGAPTTIVGDETIDVTDTQPWATGPWQTSDLTGSTTWTYTGGFDCPVDATLYEDGIYTYDVPNTATITQTGQSDDELVDVTCYAPTVAKTADTSYARRYEWTIDKASDGSYDRFIGESADHPYTITVDKTGFVDSGHTVTGSIVVTNPNPSQGMLVDVSDVVEGNAADLSCGGSLWVAAGTSASCDYTAAVPSGLDGTNTATVDFNGAAFPASAPYAFGAPDTEIDATINITDTHAVGPWTASDDATFTYDLQFDCPSDPAAYTNGVAAQLVDVNTATIVETGASDDATVTLNCYAPVPAKTADTRWTLEYLWEITKSVDPDSHTGFAGDTFSSGYQVSVVRSEDEHGFGVYGDITVSNPNPSSDMTVALADLVDGNPAALDCGGSLVVPAGGTASCGYDADLATKTDGVNTATVNLNGFDFTANAAYAFGAPTSIAGHENVNVDDTNGMSWAASGSDSWTYNASFDCPTDTSLYTNGIYTETVPNVATIVETGQSDDADVDLTCRVPGAATIAKAVEDGPEDIGSFPFTFELMSPSGQVVEVQTLSQAGQAIFSTELREEGTWTMREVIPEGWISDDGDCTFEVSYPAAAGASFECSFTNVEKGRTKVLKLTNGVVDDSKSWTFALFAGPDGSGSTALSTATTPSGDLDLDGTLDFDFTNLDPRLTYTVCELETPAGWDSIWSVDTDGDGIVDTDVVAYNPDADLQVPEDNGTRCIDIGDGTTLPIPTGASLAFEVDNQTEAIGGQRTPGYWKNWTTCSRGNQETTAANNGGWAEGFWLLDDILASPGITWDDINADAFVYDITTCEQGTATLDHRDVQSNRKRASDPAYKLARNLLAAQLNFEAGAGICAAATDAAFDGEALLDDLDFDGTGSYLKKKKDPLHADAVDLATTLDDYNNGQLCE